MRIAVDVMGGDYAPGVVVEGIASALYEFPEFELVAVGPVDKLAYYLEKHGIAKHPRISTANSDSVVEMSEPSASSVRAKRNSSITVCAKLLKEQQVDAIVSAGHTGAAVAATKVLVRTLPGVDRPALAASMPSRNGRFILVDAGANTDTTPENLVEFAIMGGVYAEFLLGIQSPPVGLLSVGGEDSKGNNLTKETFSMLEKAPINFAGNIEGNSVFEGNIKVMVCDGFTGNVFLKCAEGLAKTIVFWLKNALTKNAFRITGALLSRNAFLELKANADADEIGGAPLLGINGICIIGHGSSSSRAVRNAIKVAGECVKFGLNDKIVNSITEWHRIQSAGAADQTTAQSEEK